MEQKNISSKNAKNRCADGTMKCTNIVYLKARYCLNTILLPTLHACSVIKTRCAEATIKYIPHFHVYSMKNIRHSAIIHLVTW
jgi:hypothetical protein